MSQNITPMLWYDGDAEEAANLYVSIFPKSKILKVAKAPADNPSGKKGSVLTVEFEINGTKFTALNGGPEFKFTEAVSFVVPCENQKEVDTYWSKLTANGGEESQCGWLKDKYGLSWQITPTILPRLLADPDKARAGRVMQAMLQMKKIDIATLERAAEGQLAGAGSAS